MKLRYRLAAVALVLLCFVASFYGGWAVGHQYWITAACEAVAFVMCSLSVVIVVWVGEEEAS